MHSGCSQVTEAGRFCRSPGVLLCDARFERGLLVDLEVVSIVIFPVSGSTSSCAAGRSPAVPGDQAASSVEFACLSSEPGSGRRFRFGTVSSRESRKKSDPVRVHRKLRTLGIGGHVAVAAARSDGQRAFVRPRRPTGSVAWVPLRPPGRQSREVRRSFRITRSVFAGLG